MRLHFDWLFAIRTQLLGQLFLLRLEDLERTILVLVQSNRHVRALVQLLNVVLLVHELVQRRDIQRILVGHLRRVALLHADRVQQRVVRLLRVPVEDQRIVRVHVRIVLAQTVAVVVRIAGAGYLPVILAAALAVFARRIEPLLARLASERKTQKGVLLLLDLRMAAVANRDSNDDRKIRRLRIENEDPNGNINNSTGVHTKASAVKLV